jgi:L-amino acid N-acyltransferase YncA
LSEIGRRRTLIVPGMNGGGSQVFVVRDALDERDAAGCLEIYAPYVRDTAVSFEERVPTVREFVQRVQEVSAAHTWLVFEQEGRIAGFAYGSSHRARAAYRWAVDVTVYVALDWHRRGVGRQLYSELMPRLRRQGFRVACAGITLPNEASIGLHRALGFQPIGVYQRIGFKHGAWHDVSWWRLELAPGDTDPPQEPRGPHSARIQRCDIPAKYLTSDPAHDKHRAPSRERLDRSDPPQPDEGGTQHLRNERKTGT